MAGRIAISAAARFVCATLTGMTLFGVGSGAAAEGLTGVCPDGSMFIVQQRASVPCKNARFVDDPSKTPPIRPELLPHPYTWQVDQEARNPNNPYQLLEAAEKIRAARRGQVEAEAAPGERRAPGTEQTRARVPAGARPNGGVPTLALSPRRAGYPRP